MKVFSSLGSVCRLASLQRWASSGLVLLLVVCVASVAVGQENNNYTGLSNSDSEDWFDPNNWSLGVPFDPNSDSTKIYESFNVNISAGAADHGGDDLSIGDSDVGGIATLNISGGTLSGTGSGADIRLGIGDAYDPNSASQSGAVGRLFQTGGSVTAVDYIKMSNGGEAFAAGSHYKISGGSLLIKDQLELGRDGGVVQEMIRFEVIGTGPTSITIGTLSDPNDPSSFSGGDIKVNRVHAQSPAHPTFAFTIDGTPMGVTPIVALDELQLGNSEEGDDPDVGKLFLELSLSAVPTFNDIVLFKARRISMDEQFEGLPDGADVSATFGPNLYTWTINYYESNFEPPEPVVVLSNLRVTVIPEPGTIALLVLAGIPMALRRRRRSC